MTQVDADSLGLSFINYFPSVIVCVSESHLVYEYLDCMKYAGGSSAVCCSDVPANNYRERGRMIYWWREQCITTPHLTSVLLLRMLRVVVRSVREI